MDESASHTSGQLDIFAAAAEEDAVPHTAWTEPEGAWAHWNASLGPHPSWEDACEHRQDKDAIDVYQDKDRFRARVFVEFDRLTGLWIGGFQADAPTAGHCRAPTYYPAAYRSREACIAAWTERALAQIETYRAEAARSAA